MKKKNWKTNEKKHLKTYSADWTAIRIAMDDWNKTNESEKRFSMFV